MIAVGPIFTAIWASMFIFTTTRVLGEVLVKDLLAVEKVVERRSTSKVSMAESKESFMEHFSDLG